MCVCVRVVFEEEMLRYGNTSFPTQSADTPGAMSSGLNISPTLPIIGGISSVGSTGSVGSGSTNIGPTSGFTPTQSEGMTENEQITIHAAGKPWQAAAQFQPRFGDQRATRGHEFQILPGDICFVHSANKSAASYGSAYDHQVLIAELAKVNECLAYGYNEIKTSMTKPGLTSTTPINVGFGGGNSTKNLLANRIAVSGLDPKDTLKQLIWYMKGKEPDISKMSIYDLLILYDDLFKTDDYPSSDDESYEGGEEDEDGNVFFNDKSLPSGTILTTTKNNALLLGKKRNISNYPHNSAIYAKYYELFPEKSRYGNSLQIRDTIEELFTTKMSKMKREMKLKGHFRFSNKKASMTQINLSMSFVQKMYFIG